MGKYMKKTKIAGDQVAVMEVVSTPTRHQSQSSPLGVRTRAKTLALQRLQKASLDSSTSYLQLRSRRLEKKEPTPSPKSSCPNPRGKSRLGPADSGSAAPAPKKEEDEVVPLAAVAVEAAPESEAGVEVSFGENVLEVESRSRSTRETTPCSLIRDSENIGTPGSTTRPTNKATTSRSIQSSSGGIIPTSHEMEEFFSGAEQHHQRKFAEKYNFDPVNDRPLPGRFEWVKVEP